MKPPTNSFLAFLPIAIGMAFAFAVVFVLALISMGEIQVRASNIDGVFAAALLISALCGVLAWPLLWWFLRRADLYEAVPCVAIGTITCIAVSTPYSSMFGFPGAFVWLFVTCAVARRFCTKLPWEGHCPKCGYDLRGTLAAGIERCPECGAGAAT